jgi:outer membrane protein assembly factor BamB
VVDWQVVPTTPPDQYFTPDFTNPVIADGQLYVVNRYWFGPNEASPDQHLLRAYDTTTGDERWAFTIPQGPGRSVPTRPAIGDGVVLVGQGRRLHAVGIAEGSEAWSRRLDGAIDAIYPTRDRTYVKAHWSVVALNARSERTWTREFDAFPETLARGNDNLYVAAGRRLLALNPATGDVRWQRMLPAVAGGYAVKSLVTVADGVFALQNGGDLHAFSETGTHVRHADGRYRSLSTDGSRLYARTEGTLRALAVTTGTKEWEVRCEDLADCDSAGGFRKPVVTDTALYSSHSSGRLVAVRPTTGTVLWTLDAPTDFDHLSLGSDAIYGVGFEFEPLVKLRSSEA